MNTSLLRVLAALLALTFIVAACASDTGSEWTFAPVTAQGDSTEEAAPTEEAITQEQAGEADPAEAAEAESEPAAEELAAAEPAAAEPAAAEPAAEEPAAEEPVAEEPVVAGEPRIIMLQADSALRFTDASGQQVRDIPVTPGETVRFQINNTAGFAHNFYIGTDEELSLPSSSTEIGIPDWNTGIQELDWVVPEDITGLKFGCTVPGHYTLMQGTFSVDASAPAEGPAAEEPAAEEPASEEPAAEDPAEAVATTAPDEAAEPQEGQAVGAEDVRVIPLEADAALRFTQDGQQIREIPVTPGEKVIFRIDNTAGFAHNFYIGTNDELMVASATTDVGIPDWDSGVMDLEWVVPDDLTGLKFGCTVPGHYTLMQGDFVLSP